MPRRASPPAYTVTKVRVERGVVWVTYRASDEPADEVFYVKSRFPLVLKRDRELRRAVVAYAQRTGALDTVDLASFGLVNVAPRRPAPTLVDKLLRAVGLGPAVGLRTGRCP